MDTFKNDILLELKKTAREHSGHSNDLNLNDIVDVKEEMKSASPYIIQDTMDQDDTVCAKKESKIESTPPVQDKMDQDDTEHIKKVSKMVSMEEDCNVHIARLTQSNQKPGSKTPLSHNVHHVLHLLASLKSPDHKNIAQLSHHKLKFQKSERGKKSKIHCRNLDWVMTRI